MSLFFLAKRFVAGEEFRTAIPAIQQLNEKGIHVTVNMLGEHEKDRATAEEAQREYLSVLDHIRREHLDANVSIKPTQIGMDVGDDFCYEMIAPIAAKAADNGNFIRLDMEGSPYTQRTLDLFFRLHQDYRNVGIVIQAYLYRSVQDVEALSKANARVRLCKGAYKESRGIAYQRMADIRKAFLTLTESLIRNGLYPGIATHDDILIDAVKRFAAEQNISRDQFEFQMLYGMRVEAQEKLVKEGFQMRVYVPYGPHWAPYFYRRLRERKENIWFVVRNLWRK